MSAAIGWIEGPGEPGRWGSPAALALPLADRGLLLADGVFETLLVEAGRAWLLGEHLERWQRGADGLGLPPPPPRQRLQPLIGAAIARSGIGAPAGEGSGAGPGGAAGALRLNWSRGSGGRGLEPPAPEEPGCGPRFWLQLSAWTPRFSPLRTRISRLERRNPHSLLAGCKSFAYAAQVAARREARLAGADDALLLSVQGTLSCGSAANLLLRRRGRWWTPSLASGCLPGVMRRRALELGLAAEAELAPQDLLAAEAALLINSLGCRPIASVDGGALPHLDAAAAESFWRCLLAADQSQPWVEMR
ncbi:MAG: aminotransferase class IV [Synechococcaceae cyanobacterium]|nr:aminotransferase class IV [Synechococcaceae cyanobacterium]